MRPATSDPAEIEVPVSVLAFATRERARTTLRAAFSRRRTQLTLVRKLRDFEAAFHKRLIDVAVVDLGAPNDDTPRLIELAREFPATPFVGLTPLRVTDASIVARCASSDFADVAIDGVDDGVLRDLVWSLSFSARFAHALAAPPDHVHIDTPLKLKCWRLLIKHGGRPVLTEDLARALGITREHLSRAFASAPNAPNVKRVIDLVRILAAAELAKNPGYDVGDLAAVLGFASSSHLSTTAQRVVGTRPSSLARLRAVDLFERFGQGRARSRRPNKPKLSH